MTDWFNSIKNKIGEVASGFSNFIKAAPAKLISIGETATGWIKDKALPTIGDFVSKAPELAKKGIESVVDLGTGITDKVFTQLGKNINSVWGGEKGSGVAGAIGANINSAFNTNPLIAPIVLAALGLGGLLLIKIK